MTCWRMLKKRSIRETCSGEIDYAARDVDKSDPVKYRCVAVGTAGRKTPHVVRIKAGNGRAE